MGKDKHFTAGILELINMINCRKYKAIILYLLGEMTAPGNPCLYFSAKWPQGVFVPGMLSVGFRGE
jgi:hypothetical protein